MKIRLETAANWIIIVTGLMVAVLLAARFADNQRQGPRKVSESYRPGDKLTTGEVPVDFSKAPQTLVLVVSSQCHYCTASMPFYRDLLTGISRAQNHTQVVAAGLLEKTTALQKYLNDNQLAVDQIITVSTAKTKFKVTPTVLLVDRNGIIKGVWTGMLSTEQSQKDLVRVITLGHA